MSTPRSIRVALADDQPIFRAGLRTMIEESSLLEFVGEASDGNEAVSLAEKERPDVILMDIRMPGLGGIEATRQITQTVPETGVLMLTMLEDDSSVFAAMRAGARGYILKGSGPDHIIRAVVAINDGEAIFGASIATRISAFFRAGVPDPARPFPSLSRRENDILLLIATGLPNRAIAERLGLSEKTVRNNVSNILTKLLVPDRSGAIVKAREAGLGSGG